MTMNIGHKAIATPVQSPTLKEIKQEAANAQSEPVGMMATGHTPEETEGLSCKLSADRQAVEGKLHKSNHAIGHAATGSKGGDFVATNLRKSDGTSGGAMVAMRKDPHAGGHSAAVGSKGGDFAATTGSAPVGVTASLAKSNVT